jgi:hypothetical protein
VLPFGGLWYGKPDAASKSIAYAKFWSRSHDAVIRVYDEARHVLKTHEKGTNLNKFRQQRKAKDNVVTLRFDQVVGWSFTHLVS